MSAKTISDLAVQLQILGRDIEVEAARRLEATGTSFRNVSVLLCADGVEKTQTELAELACLDKSTMVHTMDALEAEGLAARKPAPHDRRARVVEVTDKGRQLIASTSHVLDDLYGEVLGRLPQADRAPFLRSLAALASGRSAAPAEPGERAPRRRSAR